MTTGDGFGFDKAARNQAAREKREKETEPPPLEPAFPYVSIPFDFGFFGIPANLGEERGEDEESED